MHDWTDPARELPHEAIERNVLLTDVSLYWLTGTAASSAQLYYEARTQPSRPATPSGVPTGIAVFPPDPALHRLAKRGHLPSLSADRGHVEVALAAAVLGE